MKGRPWGGAAALLLVASLAGAQGPSVTAPEGMMMRDGLAALRARDVGPAVKWVRKGDEAELSAAFKKALATGRRSSTAREVADGYFLATLVRLHGSPAAAPVTAADPVLSEIDRSLDGGAVDYLAESMAADVERSIRQRFLTLKEEHDHANENTSAGRAFAAEYDGFVQYVRTLFRDIGAPGGVPEN